LLTSCSRVRSCGAGLLVIEEPLVSTDPASP
jgi:hypothetical protein